ncbi:MAG: TIGR04086 family membrane protein [Bacillota bacterium]|nr:TIGR04086 family membrane protein [Bacillota bacterium]
MKIYKTAFTQSSTMHYVKAVAIGVLSAAIICMLLISLITFVLVKSQNLPANIISLVVLIISCISTFFGGYITVRILKNKGLLFGMITGLFVFLIVLIAGLSSSTETISAITLTKAAIMVISGAIGGIFSINKKSKKPKY